MGPWGDGETLAEAVEVAEDLGAGGGLDVDAAIELELGAVGHGAFAFGVGDHGGGELGGAGALALGLHVGDEVVGLGEADALDAPVDVDEFLDELDLGGGGGLVVGELVLGDQIVDFAGFVGEEGAIEREGDGAAAAGFLGRLGTLLVAFGGFGATGFGAVDLRLFGAGQLVGLRLHTLPL